MLQIGRLSIHLPKSLQHRANDIADELVGCLSGLPLQKSLRIERLTVPAISIHSQAGNQEIARSMATAIHAGIGGKK